MHVLGEARFGPVRLLLLRGLPHKLIRLFADIVESELSQTPYEDIKQRLVASHQLSDFQKAERLFQMPALGGRKPSELMAAMLETCPRGKEKTNLFVCIFQHRLPWEIRVLLAKADHKDLKTLATQADELWALPDNNGGGGVVAVQENPEADFLAAISGDRRRGSGVTHGKTRGGGYGRGGKAAPTVDTATSFSIFRISHQTLALVRLSEVLVGRQSLAGARRSWWWNSQAAVLSGLSFKPKLISPF